MKHVFVINKISGKGSAFKAIPLIEKVCKEKKLDYMIEVTEYANHTKEIIESMSHDKKMAGDMISVVRVESVGTFNIAEVKFSDFADKIKAVYEK